MDFTVTDILSGELVPVLLGWSSEANETAHRMFRKYGVVSHVFCEHVSFAQRISLCMKFHPVKSTAHDRLMLEALTDFATQLGHADVILYLIPCTEAYANMLWHNREALERYFVIADKAEMEQVWFGESVRPKLKGESI